MHRFAAHHGEQHLRVRDLLHRNLEHVAVEDDEVGELARLERADIAVGVELIRGSAVMACRAVVTVSPGSVLSRPAYLGPAAGSFSRVMPTLRANHSLTGSTGWVIAL